MAANEAKKHHYVPQFYMRRFACADDENKVMVLERHCNVVVADRKSIEGIGYEERLHDCDDNGAPASIEGDLNKAIETPFSQNGTWLKISGGNCAGLDETDRLPLYGFARYLQLRNLETLRFIETQHARYLTGELEDELTDEERDMHAWIASDPGAAHELFRARDGNDASSRRQRDQRHRLPNANRTSIVHQPCCSPLAPRERLHLRCDVQFATDLVACPGSPLGRVHRCRRTVRLQRRGCPAGPRPRGQSPVSRPALGGQRAIHAGRRRLPWRRSRMGRLHFRATDSARLPGSEGHLSLLITDRAGTTGHRHARLAALDPPPVFAELVT